MAILTPLPTNFSQKIRSEMTEAIQLSYNDIIPAVIHLRVTQANTTTQAFDTFRMPGDYAFLCSELRAHIAINAPQAETTAGTGLLNVGGMRNRIIVKALNAKIKLTNADRDDLRFVETDLNNTVDGTANNYLSMAMLMPIAGGRPIKFINDYDVAPLIMPANERIKLSFQQSVALGVDDQQTEYGVALIGALVRARG